MTVAELNVKITSDLNKITSDLKSLKGNLDTAQKQTSSFAASMKSMLGMAGVAGLTAGLISMGKAALQGAANLQKNKVAFETMLGSASRADKLLKDMQKFGAETPFELPSIVTAGKQLIAFGISSDEVIEKMTNLGNAAMGNEESFSRLSLAYGKIAAKGKASMEELNMLTEAGVPILQELADNAGVSTGALLKMVEQGKIGFKDVDKALTDLTTGTGKFSGIMEKQSKTMGGAWSNLQDTFTQMLTGMGDAVSPFVTNTINGLNILLTGFTDMVKTMANLWDEYVVNPQREANVKWAIETINRGKKWYAGGAWEKAGQILTAEKARRDSMKTTGTNTIKPEIITQDSSVDFSKIADDRVKLDLELTKKLYEQANDRMSISHIEEMQALQSVDKVFAGTKQLEEERTKVKEYYAKQREQIEAEEQQKTLTGIQTGLQMASQFASQLTSIFAQANQNRMMDIENERTEAMQSIEERYNREKAAIESSVTDTRERDRQLKALDEKRARDEKKANEKLDKEKRKAAYENAKIEKAMAITTATINGAIAITNIWSRWAANPIVAGTLTGITAGLTAAQIGLIAAQPLPKLAAGGLFQGPAIVGEAGREFAFPLDGKEGKAAVREMASGILDMLSERVNDSATMSASTPAPARGGGDVYLDGSLVGKWISDSADRGDFTINKRVVI